MDKTFYMVPFVMLAAWTSVLVARGILRRDTPLQILNDSVLSVVVTLMRLIVPPISRTPLPKGTGAICVVP